MKAVQERNSYDLAMLHDEHTCDWSIRLRLEHQTLRSPSSMSGNAHVGDIRADVTLLSLCAVCLYRSENGCFLKPQEQRPLY